MSVEIILPTPLSAIIHGAYNEWIAPVALQRQAGRLLIVGENKDFNTALRHYCSTLPRFYESSLTRRKK